MSFSLVEIRNNESPVNLNEEEKEYLDFTKDYRQFDENRFKDL
jgi:hypothetical protein